jgi:RNA polymerase sigma-70 factor, ECF subfamily
VESDAIAAAAMFGVPGSEADTVGAAVARRAAYQRERGHQAAMPEASRTAGLAFGRSRRSLTRRGLASDAALVREAQRGSEAAVEELFARHWSAAYRAAFLVTADGAAAEDIAQEAFLSALRALPSFDVRRPLRPWLHRIVVNRAIDFARARALRNEVGADTVGEAPAPRGHDSAALGVDVLAALMGLGPEQRAVVVLRYLLEFTPGEIGEMLGLPRGTVNSRLRRGLDALGNAMEHEPR